MMKPALLVFTALSLTACVGTGVDTTASHVTFNKAETISACPEFTGVSAQYAQPVEGMPFRCGPQTQSPVTYQ